jgi:hypothetical protein
MDFTFMASTKIVWLLSSQIPCYKDACTFFCSDCSRMLGAVRQYSRCDVDARYRKLRMLLRYHDICSISQSDPCRQPKVMCDVVVCEV